MSADDDRKPLPPPFARKAVGPAPAPAIAAEHTPPPEVDPPTVVETPPVAAPELIITTAPGTEIVDAWPVPLAARLPPWLRSRRVQIGLGVVAAIFLIGIIAAIAADGPPPKAAVPIAGAARVDAGPGVAAAADGPDAAPSEPAADEEEPVTDDETVEPDDEPAPVKKKTGTKKSTSKRTTSKSEPAAKKPSAGRMVRLTVKTEPAGASVRVDGEELRGGEAMVRSGSTVKVTATKRGYKRASKSVKVTKATPIVIKLKKM